MGGTCSQKEPIGFQFAAPCKRAALRGLSRAGAQERRVAHLIRFAFKVPGDQSQTRNGVIRSLLPRGLEGRCGLPFLVGGNVR